MAWDSPARILVTRAAEDATLFAFFLIRAGFEPVEVPTIERKWRVLEVAEVLQSDDTPDWIVLTSATAANVVAAACPVLGQDIRIAAVGSSTARRAQELGLPISLIPETFNRASLIKVMGDVSGTHICYPRADLAPSTLTDAFRAAGARVTDVVSYTNTAPDEYKQAITTSLPVAITTLFSGSAARRVATAVEPADRARLGIIAAIGPSTATAAKEAGLEVGAIATPHTVAGMVELVRKIAANHSTEPLSQ